MERNPQLATESNYDLIIVGGGVYGISVALMASLNGLKPLLLDKSDFGSETTFNSLRIVHGGLRYLQKLDLHRFKESVQERRWFFRNFPGLVEPIPCLMPLYGKGLKRRVVFGPALMLNDLLSSHRNKGVQETVHLKNGYLVNSKKVQTIFPGVDTEGLQGGAVWFDGSMPDSQIIVNEMLKVAVANGATALNYCEAQSLIFENDTLKGIRVKEERTGENLEFKAPVIINAAGPWCRSLGKSFDTEHENLFYKSIAWNAVFDRKQLSDHAIALTPKTEGAQTYFLRPWKGKLFAGTIHEACDKDTPDSIPSEESIQKFIDNLNFAIPELDLKLDEVIRIYSGFLPATEENKDKIAVREVIIDHGEHNGPSGLFSVSGVKFTTARLVAEKTLLKAFPELSDKKLISDVDPTHVSPPPFSNLENLDSNLNDIGVGASELTELMSDSSILHMDDLLFRRTSIGDSPTRATEAIRLLESSFSEPEAEQNRVKEAFYNLSK